MTTNKVSIEFEFESQEGENGFWNFLASQMTDKHIGKFINDTYQKADDNARQDSIVSDIMTNGSKLFNLGYDRATEHF